jgi:hypothetical protein
MASVIRAAESTFKTALLVTGAIAFTAIGGGIMAIIWDTKADTRFNFLGLSLTTTHVGVAMVGLGVAAAILVGRKTLHTIERIGAGPYSEAESPRRNSRVGQTLRAAAKREREQARR